MVQGCRRPHTKMHTQTPPWAHVHSRGAGCAVARHANEGRAAMPAVRAVGVGRRAITGRHCSGNAWGMGRYKRSRGLPTGAAQTQLTSSNRTAGVAGVGQGRGAALAQALGHPVRHALGVPQLRIAGARPLACAGDGLAPPRVLEGGAARQGAVGNWELAWLREDWAACGADQHLGPPRSGVSTGCAGSCRAARADMRVSPAPWRAAAAGAAAASPMQPCRLRRACALVRAAACPLGEELEGDWRAVRAGDVTRAGGAGGMWWAAQRPAAAHLSRGVAHLRSACMQPKCTSAHPAQAPQGVCSSARRTHLAGPALPHAGAPAAIGAAVVAQRA